MAPSPNVAESDSCAMLPTLATIIIASAGHAIMPTDTPEPAVAPGTGGSAAAASRLAIRGPISWVDGRAGLARGLGGIDVGDHVLVGRQLVGAVGLHDEPLVGDRVGGDELLPTASGVPGEQQRL